MNPSVYFIQTFVVLRWSMYTSARISQHYLHNSYSIRTHSHIWNNLSQTNLQACIFACHAPFNLQHTHEHVESRIVVVVNCRHRQHRSVRLFKLLILHRIYRVHWLGSCMRVRLLDANVYTRLFIICLHAYNVADNCLSATSASQKRLFHSHW